MSTNSAIPGTITDCELTNSFIKWGSDEIKGTNLYPHCLKCTWSFTEEWVNLLMDSSSGSQAFLTWKSSSVESLATYDFIHVKLQSCQAVNIFLKYENSTAVFSIFQVSTHFLADKNGFVGDDTMRPRIGQRHTCKTAKAWQPRSFRGTFRGTMPPT